MKDQKALKKPTPTKSKLELREPAKPLAQLQERPLRADHPVMDIFRQAQEQQPAAPSAPPQAATPPPPVDALPSAESPQNQQLTSQPVNHAPVDQSTTLVNQLTTEAPPQRSVNQLTSQSVVQQEERFYPSRRKRRLKGIRFPVDNLDRYELWCLLNKVDFQDAADFALNWLTSQPINQLTGQPANQSTTLINNDLVNNELIINDEKGKRVLGKYAELTGKAVTKKDQEAYKEVSHLDEAVIVQGLQTAIQRALAAGSRVNSFRYAINCIREASAAQPATPAPSAPPAAEMTSEERQGHVNAVAERLRGGEEIETLDSELSPLFKGQWPAIRSMALAQSKVSLHKQPEG